MAALLGTNTALLLFQGIEQAKSPDNVREFALAVIAAALPFQAIYFLIYTFVLEHEPQLPPERIRKLDLASALCQVALNPAESPLALMVARSSSASNTQVRAQRGTRRALDGLTSGVTGLLAPLWLS